MYIVQLETLSSLETGLYEKIELENFIDICEDGSVIGGGYTKLTELQGNKFEKIKNEIINKLVILGCIKKEYDTIYFTSMFAENFFYPYYERLKSYFANSTIEDFCKEDVLTKYEKLFYFDNIEITSNSLDAFLTNFKELIRNNFYPYNSKKLDYINSEPFKIVSILEGY